MRKKKKLVKSKKEKKPKKRCLLYRVIHQENKPNLFLFFIEVFFATWLSFIGLIFNIIFDILSVAFLDLGVAGILGVLACNFFQVKFDFLDDLFRVFVAYTIVVLMAMLFYSKRKFLLAILSFIAIGLGVSFVWSKYYPMYQEYDNYAKEVVENSTVDDFKINESSIIYASDGSVLATLKETSDLEYIPYDEIPKAVIDAFIAIEDRTFWENDGVDYYGIIRVIYNYALSQGEEEHGASTITQQLVRNTYLTREVSLERKIKEILISRYMTKKYTKEQIMEFYCNDICFANAIYGVQGAAKGYFDKDISELNLSQIAYICAIPNRPAYYDPYKYPERALARRDKILSDMVECGFITEAKMNVAKDIAIDITKPEYEFNDYLTTFATDSAIKYLMKLDDFEFKYEFADTDEYNEYHDKYNSVYEDERHKLYTGGYSIYTTLDKNIYSAMQEKLDKTLSFNDKVDEETGIYMLQGALTVIDNSNGKVIAVVGGRSQENTTYSFNRAYQSYRQPGSSIKPVVVYTPALMMGWSATSSVENIDVTAAKEKGAKVQELHGETMTLRSAVEHSKNGVAWKIFDAITPQYGMSFPVAMHYSNLCPDDYFNASALGGLTHGVTTVEQASAYSTLANHGRFREPTCLTSIKTTDGLELYHDDEEITVYSAKAADDMVDILKGVLTNGTASGLRWYSQTKIEAFCKTGTTNNSKDGWLCGATPQFSVAVWVGFDTPKPLNNLYGATYPGQIWKECMLELINGYEDGKFIRDTEDESYNTVLNQATGYYSYLEGRDDSEVLSDGYTVADYRTDRVTGEGVYAIINQINSMDMSQPDSVAKLNQLYAQGQGIIQQIYSRKYTAEMIGNLDEAYNSKLNPQPQPQPQPQTEP